MAKTLEDALNEIGEFKEHRDLMLVLWTQTTIDCSPVSRLIRVIFSSKMGDEVAKDIIRGIDSKSRILSIVDEKLTVHVVEDAVEFSQKKCGDCECQKKK